MFAERLKELREKNNLSQQQLAKEINISQSAIAKWELNKTQPTLTAIIKIANYFNCSTDDILN